MADDRRHNHSGGCCHSHKGDKHEVSSGFKITRAVARRAGFVSFGGRASHITF